MNQKSLFNKGVNNENELRIAIRVLLCDVYMEYGVISYVMREMHPKLTKLHDLILDAIRMLLEDAANSNDEIFNDIKVEYNRVKDARNLEEWSENMYTITYTGLCRAREALINPVDDKGELRIDGMILILDVIKYLAYMKPRLIMKDGCYTLEINKRWL